MNKNIEDLTLLLMYLTSWVEEGYVVLDNDNVEKSKIKTCWKGYDFDILNKLTDDGYLYYSKHTSKSVGLTPKGEELAKELMNKYLK